MWWCFGWPYETSVAMARLVFSGVFDRHPGLKIVTHHLGGGMIPFFDGRIGAGMEVLGARTSDEDYSKVLPSLKRPHLDYFREFYADTALFGAGNGLLCGLDFFGADRVVFATDAPLGPIAKTIAAVEALGLDAQARVRRSCTGMPQRLMKLKLAYAHARMFAQELLAAAVEELPPAAVTTTIVPCPATGLRITSPRSIASSHTVRRGHEVRHASSTSA